MRRALLSALAAAALACGAASEPQPPPSLPPVTDTAPCHTATGAAGAFITGFVDADGDGHGAGPPVVLCVEPGAGLPRGYAATADDCDDRSPTGWRLQPFYADADHDGVAEDPAILLCAEAPPPGYSATAGDCAPGDPTRWQLLPYAFRDRDADGFTVPETGTVCSGATLPPGYLDVPSGLDCDDFDPGRFASIIGYLDGDGDGVGDGAPVTLCTAGALPAPYVASGGDCAPFDASRWQLLPYAATDGDGDGWLAAAAGTLCSGAALPWGYAAEVPAVQDCDDHDAGWGGPRPAWPDADRDGVGDGEPVYVCYRPGSAPPAGLAAAPGDCAPDDASRWQVLPYAYRDADGDGFFAAQPGTVCSGRALPAGYANGAGGGLDCDDADPTVHASLVGFADADGDGVGAGPAVTFCTAGALPAGWVATGTDCAPEDPERFRTVTNVFADRDGDGFTVPEPGPLCVSAALPAPYLAAAHGKDCDDADPARWRWTVVYPDQDGDGVGAPPRSILCLGADLPAGVSTAGWDVDDANPAVQWDGADADLVLTLW
ncbi:MAG TPA: hypothetical protein VFP65_22300 [Anaeromyxobacteraceae bacterium]|nr:hypothetical protein [Anaeromyxobacteraceae bacterium]